MKNTSQSGMNKHGTVLVTAQHMEMPSGVYLELNPGRRVRTSLALYSAVHLS